MYIPTHLLFIIIHIQFTIKSRYHSFKSDPVVFLHSFSLVFSLVEYSSTCRLLLSELFTIAYYTLNLV